MGNWGRFDDNANVETRTHTDFNEIKQRVSPNNPLAHDKNGNTTDTGLLSVGGTATPGGGLRLEFDALNRVKFVYDNKNTPGNTGDDTLEAEYWYDCHNRRFAKEILNAGINDDQTNGFTLYYYNGWRVVEERDGNEAILRQYSYGNYLDEVWTLDDRSGGVSVASLNDGTGGQRNFYHQNTLYHVYANTDETGAIAEAVQSYDAYGKATVITGAGTDTTWFTSDDVTGSATAVNNPFFYTGQRLDPETGLMYYKNRYYSTGLGRFVSRDPMGYSVGDLGLYTYVENRPLRNFDTYGLMSCDDFDRCIQRANDKGLEGLKRDLRNNDCPWIANCCDCQGGTIEWGGMHFYQFYFGYYEWPEDPLPKFYFYYSKICVYAANISTCSDAIRILKHEMIHALQSCTETDLGCSGCLCKEMGAYFKSGQCAAGGGWASPGESEKDCVKRNARDSCTINKFCQESKPHVAGYYHKPHGWGERTFIVQENRYKECTEGTHYK
ncbi:MAG: RHS repeat-associated core domain-containing protein [Planctomycetota bacterium]|nr:RHS repeat-associated core domain-containing protein [Planctomycetota bacterium]